MIEPKCIALIACDYAYEDAACGRYSLLGTMPQIFAERFPHIHPSLYVYFELSQGRGQAEVELALLSPDLLETVVKTRRRITFNDPFGLHVGRFQFENLLLPVDGRYTLRVSVDDKEIGSTILPVHLRESRDGCETEETENEGDG